MNTYKITYSVGTSRHDEQRFQRTVTAKNLRAAMPYVTALEARPNTTVTRVELEGPVFA